MDGERYDKNAARGGEGYGSRNAIGALEVIRSRALSELGDAFKIFSFLWGVSVSVITFVKPYLSPRATLNKQLIRENKAFVSHPPRLTPRNCNNVCLSKRQFARGY